MKNLKMSIKLAIGFGILIVIMAAMSAITAYTLNGLRFQAVSLSDKYIAELRHAIQVNDVFADARFYIRDFTLTENPASKEEAQKYMGELEKSIAEMKNFSAQHDDLPVLRETSDKFSKELGGLKNSYDSTYKSTDEVQAYRAEVLRLRPLIMSDIMEFFSGQFKLLEKEVTGGYANIEAFHRRERRLQTITTMLQEMAEVGHLTSEAQSATLDQELVKQAMAHRDKVEELARGLLAESTIPANIEDLTRLVNNLDAFEMNLSEMSRAWAIQDRDSETRNVMTEDFMQ